MRVEEEFRCCEELSDARAAPVVELDLVETIDHARFPQREKWSDDLGVPHRVDDLDRRRTLRRVTDGEALERRRDSGALSEQRRRSERVDRVAFLACPQRVAQELQCVFVGRAEAAL